MSDISRLRRQIFAVLIVGAVAAVSGRIINLQQGKLRNIDLTPTHGSNDRSRWATVRALVDHHTYVIGRRSTDPESGRFEDTGIVTEDGWKTVDKVLDPEPTPDAKGKVQYFYSSKPPLFPTMVAGEYWLLKQLGLSISTDLPWVVRIILLTFNVLPLAIYLYLLGKLAEQYGNSDWGRLFLVFAAGFGTFVTSFGNTLNNHTLASYFALFGLAAFLRAWNGSAVAEVGQEATTESREEAAAEKPAETAIDKPKEVAVEAPVPASPESTASSPEKESVAGEAPALATAEKRAEVGEEPAPVSGAEKEAEKQEEQGSEEGVFTSFRVGESAAKSESGPPSSSSLPPVKAAGAGSYFLAGLFSALAAAVELPALAFTVAALVLLFRCDKQRTLRFFIPPVVIVVGLFFLTNYLALGRLLPAYTEAGGDSPWYQYDGSHWRQDKPKPGIDFAQEDKLTYAVHFLVGHHGVFALSPIFLMSLAGMAAILWRGRKNSLFVVGLVAAYLTVVVLGFYIWKTNNYGGFSSGPRWLMWLTPFWLLTLLPIADKLASCRWGRTLALVLLFFSVLSASYPAWIPWQHPWIYRYVEDMGLMRY